jgi:hypothetical protein
MWLMEAAAAPPMSYTVRGYTSSPQLPVDQEVRLCGDWRLRSHAGAVVGPDAADPVRLAEEFRRQLWGEQGKERLEEARKAVQEARVLRKTAAAISATEHDLAGGTRKRLLATNRYGL